MSAQDFVVLSPHLEDAVLGCGELIAARRGAVVVSAFAGILAETGVVPPWDAACGFGSPRQAMVVRRREDREALERLDAEPCWLGLLDRQYRRADDAPELALKLARALRRHHPASVALPLGLAHRDHVLTRSAALSIFLRGGRGEWLVYEEPQYRRFPQLAEALRALAAQGLHAEPLGSDGRYEAEKQAALRCYESQMRGRGGRALDTGRERYWRISR